MKLTDIIKGTEYDLSLFSDKHIAELENRIVERKTNGGGKILSHLFSSQERNKTDS